MMTPDDEIEMFIEQHATAESRRLDVAIGFARSMVCEMRACTAKWEATERALAEEMRRRSDSVN